jgi:hypothetical protein
VISYQVPSDNKQKHDVNVSSRCNHANGKENFVRGKRSRE